MYFFWFLAGWFVGVITFIVFAENAPNIPPVKREREKAIEAGVGRWTIDEKTGDRKFVYGKE